MQHFYELKYNCETFKKFIILIMILTSKSKFSKRFHYIKFEQ